MRVLVITLALSLTLAGCASRPASSGAQPVPAAAAGETFTLALGDSVRLGKSTLRFDSVAEDSRCPRNVTCSWEGNARVAFVSGDGHGPGRRVELNTSARFDQRATLADGVLELRGLDPSPPAGDPRMYVATLHFEAGR